MFLHVGTHAVRILKEFHMAVLIHLVIADGLHRQALTDQVQIFLAGHQAGHACAGESDLRGRGHLNDQILIAVFRQHIKNIQQLIAVLVQVMHAIGIVPHNAEVLCRRAKRRNTAHHCIGKSDAGGVGVLGHTEHTLHAGILYQFFNGVHIRSVGVHRHIHHLQPKILAHGKVAIIAGHRAQDLHFLFLAPGFTADAMGVALADKIKHQSQTLVRADDHILGRHLQQLGKQLLTAGNTVQNAVVAHIHAAGHIVLHIIHTHGQIQLLFAGLTSAHIQLQSLGLKFLVPSQQAFLLPEQFVFCHLLICSCHTKIPRNLKFPFIILPQTTAPCNSKANKKRAPQHSFLIRIAYFSFGFAGVSAPFFFLVNTKSLENT